MNLHVEPLDNHDLATFDSGNTSLDDWLRNHAHHATGQGTRTFVVTDEAGHVAGYFAVAPHLLNRTDAPQMIGRGEPHQIPAILLAKLALDRRWQGRGLGSELLVYALGIILDAARIAGGRIVIVDAIDESARRFYEHHNFQPTPNRPDRLVLRLSTVARLLDEPWP